MTNPLEEFLSELFSVKGFLQTIIIVILVFVLFSVTGALKQVDSDNEYINETLTNIEEGASSGISWFFLILRIVGAITLLALGIKTILWLLDEFGVANDISFNY